MLDSGTMPAVRIAVVGLGKIARDQHLPALLADRRFALAATVGPDTSGVEGIATFATLEALLERGPALDAVALCTPPQVRHALAARPIAGGLHVLLEKPPGATLAEVEALRSQAARAGRTVFAAWHSRFASGVAPAREWLARRTVRRVEIVWREDVRIWHPGQAWIWEPGGLGVFDPGINALSIATAILPGPILLEAATLVHPLNRAAPIAAALSLRARAARRSRWISTSGRPAHKRGTSEWRPTWGDSSWRGAAPACRCRTAAPSTSRIVSIRRSTPGSTS